MAREKLSQEAVKRHLLSLGNRPNTIATSLLLAGVRGHRDFMFDDNDCIIHEWLKITRPNWRIRDVTYSCELSTIYVTAYKTQYVFDTLSQKDLQPLVSFLKLFDQGKYLALVKEQAEFDRGP